MKTEKDFEELLRLFNKNKVKYCIIGAYAVAFYAEPRYTKDMDILVEPNRDNARKIIKSLTEFGFKNLTLEEKDLIQKEKIIQLGYEPVRIDLITSIKGCDFEEVWRNKAIGAYGKQKTIFIGLNELIKNKKKSGRKQDSVDVSKLMARKKNKK
jgi:hypothetical protein